MKDRDHPNARPRKEVVGYAGVALLFVLIVGLEWLGGLVGFETLPLPVVAPAAGIAVMAALRWRWLGLGTVFLAYAASSYITRGNLDLWYAMSYVVGCGIGMSAMRSVHQRGTAQGKIVEWASFFIFGTVLTSSIITLLLSAPALSAQAGSDISFRLMVLSLIAHMLGILAVVSVFANLRELSHGLGIWKSAFKIILATLMALTILVFGLQSISEAAAPSVFLLLALPIAMWIAKEPYSLPGGVITLFAAYLAQWLVHQDIGSALHPLYMQITLYLVVLIMVAQAFHALELDRLLAISEITRHRDALRDMVELRNAELSKLIRQSAEDTQSRKQFRDHMTHKVATPLYDLATALRSLTNDDLTADQKQRIDQAEATINQIGTDIGDLIKNPDLKI